MPAPRRRAQATVNDALVETLGLASARPPSTRPQTETLLAHHRSPSTALARRHTPLRASAFVGPDDALEPPDQRHPTLDVSTILEHYSDMLVDVLDRRLAERAQATRDKPP